MKLFKLLLVVGFYFSKAVWAGPCEIESKSENGKFHRMGDNSKYVYFTPNQVKNYDKETWTEAQKVCKDHGLTMAVIESVGDATSLQNSFTRLKMCLDSSDSHPSRQFWLGMSDNDKEGKWNDLNTGKPIEFQQFYQFEPINAPKLSVIGPNSPKPKPEDYGNYAQLKCVDQTEIAMFDSYGEAKAGVLCQYEQSHQCFKESSETNSNNKILDKLVLLGQTGHRAYYTSQKQKSWDAAKSYCSSYKGKLLDLDVQSGVDNSEVHKLYGMILNWKKEKGLPLWGHSVWTSGKYKNFREDDYFQWKSTGNKFSHSETKINWRFMEDDYYKSHKTIETFGSAQFSCVSLAPFNTKSFQHGLSDKSLAFVRSVCTVPHWLICYGGKDYVPPDKPTDPGDDDGDDGDDGGGGGGGSPKELEMWMWNVIAV